MSDPIRSAMNLVPMVVEQTNRGERALAALAANGWLAADATAVIEAEADASVAWPDGFEPLREVTVGGTRFHVGRFARP